MQESVKNSLKVVKVDNGSKTTLINTARLSLYASGVAGKATP